MSEKTVRHAGLSDDDIEALREEQDIVRWIDADAPSPMEMWRQIDGVPREDTVPLTVKQAADRENVRPDHSPSAPRAGGDGPAGGVPHL